MRKLFIFIFIILFFQVSAKAITYTVTNCASSAGIYGSLPWAVSQAKLSATDVIIEFDIPTTEAGYTIEGALSFWKIELSSMLSLSSNNIYIDGLSQTRNQRDTNPAGPEIEITAASGASMTSLIKIQAVNNCTIEGLAVNGSPGNGIQISFGNYNCLKSNYIGTTISGEAIKANASDGIYIEGGDHNLIGGTSSVYGNLISGNGHYGIDLHQSTYNNIFWNKIGTSTNETKSLGNSWTGINVFNQSHSQSLECNTIFYNGNSSHPYGILIDGPMSIHNKISRNKLFANNDVGINLSNPGNESIVPPAITSVESYPASNRTYIYGTSETSAYIEVFLVATNETDSAGEGKTYIGSTEADIYGRWIMDISGSHEGKVTSTQTDASANTSLFSTNVTIISSEVEFRPDAEIGLIAQGGDYTGAGIINMSGAGQTKSKFIYAGQTATYYIKIKNQGTTDESFVVSGTKGCTSWEVSYYSATTEGIDITSLVTSDGWATSVLATSETLAIRVEARSLTSETTSKDLYITASSSHDATKKDVVKGTAYSSVSPDTFDHFSFVYPLTAEAASTFVLTIEARNASGEITTEVNSKTELSVDYGTISPVSIEALNFSDDGIWSGNVTLSKAGTRRVIANAVSASGSFEIVVYNADAEFLETDIGVEVNLPSGVASSEVSISISEVSPVPGPPPAGKWQAGKVIEITSNVKMFSVPLNITLPLYPGAKTPEVYYWTGSNWSQDGLAQKEVTNNSISFTSTHLTIFVPFGESSSSQFAFGPSPFNPERDKTAYFWYWLNDDKATSLYVIDISGRLAYKRDFMSGSNGGRGGLNQIEWNGVGHFGSFLENGVYLYKIIQGNNVIANGKFIILR